jgi:methyltransferase-like protein
MGRAIVDQLGLKNIELRSLSILDVDDTFGTFDYIICHGVYSWVPAAVQDKILDICVRNLSPQGVAYISYNTYPGWHTRAVAREMMSYHVAQFTEAQVQVQQARAFLDFLVRAVPNSESTYGRLLREEANLLKPAPDAYLFHEHLEAENHPLYFHQFVQRARDRELQYLGESWFHTTVHDLPPAIQATVQEISTDLLRMEQYLDFIRNRTFRRTLLCHQGVTLNRSPPPEMLATFHASALARPLSAQPEVRSSAVEQFRADSDGTGPTVSVSLPILKAALVCLFEAWPRALAFNDLWTAIGERLGPAAGAESNGRTLLAEGLLYCYLSNLVALHVHPPTFAQEPGPRPTASPLARLQAATATRVTNLRHRLVNLSDLERVVLPHLDGNHDREALLEVLAAAAANGVLAIEADGQRLQASAPMRGLLAEPLENGLRRLAALALLR